MCYNLSVFNLFNKNSKEKVVVLDIRDGSVGGMVIQKETEGNSLPEKLFSVRKALPFQKNFNLKRLFYATAQAISFVASEIHKSGQNDPKKIICLVGPHMHISQRRNVKITYKQPTLLTTEILNRLISNDLHLFEEKHLTSGLAKGESSNVIFEHKIMQIKLNGYETSNPIGKKATEVSISIFASVLPRVVLADLKNVISNSFHNNNLEFHSFSFMISDVVRNLDLDKNGLVLVQIEDEITEMSVVRNGIIQNIASFPAGKNLLKRQIMDSFATVSDGADSCIKMYNNKTGNEDVIKKMTDVLLKMNEVWADLFFQTIKKISYYHLLPQSFYIVADNDCKNIFIDLFKKIELSSILVLNKPAEIVSLDNQFFDNFCKNKSECPDDIYFLAASVFAGNIPRSEGLTFYH